MSSLKTLFSALEQIEEEKKMKEDFRRFVALAFFIMDEKYLDERKASRRRYRENKSEEQARILSGYYKRAAEAEKKL